MPLQRETATASVDSPASFFDVLIEWHQLDTQGTDAAPPAARVVPPTQSNWTRGVPILRWDPNTEVLDWRDMVSNDVAPYANDFIPAFSNRWSKGDIEEVYLPLIDRLIAQKVSEWIVEGDASLEWTEFQRELDKRGLPYLLEVWQTHLNQMQ